MLSPLLLSYALYAAPPNQGDFSNVTLHASFCAGCGEEWCSRRRRWLVRCRQQFHQQLALLVMKGFHPPTHNFQATRIVLSLCSSLSREKKLEGLMGVSTKSTHLTNLFLLPTNLPMSSSFLHNFSLFLARKSL